MQVNMGKADRFVRIILVLAIALLLLSKSVSGWLAIVLGIVAVVMLITSIVGYCPLYPVLKISTVKKEKP